MTNKWVEFVKKWAAKHNQTYMCAATKTKCREAYHKANPKSKTQKKTRSNSITRKARGNKKKVQRELLKKYKAYAEYKKATGVRLE
jgi:hypothetical protein